MGLEKIQSHLFRRHLTAREQQQILLVFILHLFIFPVLLLHILVVLVLIVVPVPYRHLVKDVERYANVLEASEKLILKIPLIRRGY